VIWLLLYIIPCLFLAWYNARLIKKGKHIYHALNGALHISVAAISFFVLKDWKAPIVILLIAKLFFDTALNLMRGLSIDYVSPEVIAYTSLKEAFKKGKVTDYIEWKLFRSSAIPKIIYILLIVILIVI